MKSTGSGADFTAPITPGHQSEKGIAILQSTGRDVEVAVTRLDELSAARLSFGVQNLNAEWQFDPLPSSIDLVRSKKLRALAVTTLARSAALPDVPTVSDFVTGYEAGGWVGVGAPKETDGKIVERLNLEINAALADPEMKARLAGLGGSVLQGSPADFDRLIVGEIKKWGWGCQIRGGQAWATRVILNWSSVATMPRRRRLDQQASGVSPLSDVEGGPAGMPAT